MEKTIYYLSSCDTCKRILKELAPLDGVRLQDIKVEPVTASQLDALQRLAGSYEALFSKRARLYKDRKLNEKELSEDELRGLLLEHYTFLKRPVIRIGDQLFIGNSPKVVSTAKETLHS